MRTSVGVTLPFLLGVALEQMRAVAIGRRPLATGELPRADLPALRELLEVSGYAPAVKLGTCKADGPRNVGYCLWRFEWTKKALDWLDRGGRDRLGDFHRHWVQGLLYGYGPDSIAEFLATPSERASRSRLSCGSRTAGTARPSTGGSRCCSSSNGRRPIPGRSHPCSASGPPFRDALSIRPEERKANTPRVTAGGKVGLILGRPPRDRAGRLRFVLDFYGRLTARKAPAQISRRAE